eukprot:Selendium_serpulae@DN6327_c3_g1_i5.p1
MEESENSPAIVNRIHPEFLQTNQPVQRYVITTIAASPPCSPLPIAPPSSSPSSPSSPSSASVFSKSNLVVVDVLMVLVVVVIVFVPGPAVVVVDVRVDEQKWWRSGVRR